MTSTPVPTHTPTVTLAPTQTPTAVGVAEPGQRIENPNFIAYMQITETGAEIFTVDLSHDPPRIFNLTETSGAAYFPRWSPDLRFIAYLYYDSSTGTVDFWLFDNLGASSRPISMGGIERLGNFSWSPDSRFLVYTAVQPDGMERDIYRLDVESGEIVNLTADSPVWDSAPAWSPDGELIVFVSDRTENGKGLDDIWVMRPDGSGLKNVTGSDWEEWSPAWSPDSTKVAFYRWRLYGSDKRGPSGLWVAKVDGSEERLLIQLDGLLAVLDAPAWSPDGHSIAYQFGVPGETEVYVIPAEGGEAINVSNLPGDDSRVSWRPDSQALIFTNKGEHDLALYIVAPDGTDARPLLATGGNGLGEWAPALPPREGSARVAGDVPSHGTTKG